MKKGSLLVGLLTALILGASFIIPTHEVHFFWEEFTLFNGIFGFVGCLVLIIGTKFLAKRFLQRDERYYD